MRTKLFMTTAITAAVLFCANLALGFGGEGRVLGTVVDASGANVDGATVKVTRADVPTFSMDKTSDAKGGFTVLLLDASKVYRFHIEKDGYLPLDQDVQPTVGENLRVTFTLKKVKEQEQTPVSSAPVTAEPRPAPTTPPTLPGPVGSKYVSPDGRFSITIPGEPTIKNDPDGSVYYAWDLNNGNFVIHSVPVSGLFTATSRRASLESMKAEAIRQDANRMAFILDFHWYSLLTYTTQIPDSDIKVILIPTPGRLFSIRFAGPPYEKTYWERVQSYYFSFAVKSDGESAYKLVFADN